MKESVFHAEGVEYRYRDAPALQQLELHITAGERIAVLGANGSGKSTLLHLLDALCFAQGGVLQYHDAPLTEKSFQQPGFTARFRCEVGLVFQNPDIQLFNPTVFEEIAFGPLQMGWPQEEIRRRVHHMLDLLELSPVAERPPHRLSGGEKKRVALASVLVLEPEVLLLDEPTAGLDPASQSQVIDFIEDVAPGRTVITATHDLGIVEQIAGRCLILEQGHVAADGSPAVLLHDEALLRRTHLIYTHRHRHAGGVQHAHPHTPISHPHYFPGT